MTADNSTTSLQNKTLTVSDPSPAVVAMQPAWRMIEHLLGGTHSMRESGEWLPKQERESPIGHAYRARVATLYPALERTIGVMAGKPFAKQLTLSEDTSQTIVDLTENIDGQGRNLHAFAYGVFEETLAFGLCGVLVDMPRMVTAPGVVATQADMKQQGVRPYFVHIKHHDILGWKLRIVNGMVQLAQIRIREEIEVDDGPYGSGFIQAVRVLTPGRWELWKKLGDTETLATEDQGPTGLPEIPFAPFYGRRKGYMVGLPPLLNLAYQNVKHYQVQSDQDDSARFARKRLLVFIGVPDESMTTIEASSSSAIALPTGASVSVVQGSAESVKVGRDELADLEEQMVRTGAELLVMRPGGQRTATQDNNEAEGNKSELQRIVEVFEDSIDLCLYYAGLYMNEPTDGHVSLFKDFGASTLGDASAQLVLAMQQAGLITKATAINEEKRRGMLSADIDAEEELAAVALEGPQPGMVGLDANGNPLPLDALGNPMPQLPPVDAQGNPMPIAPVPPFVPPGA